MAIGALGRGEAPEAAYLFAREVSAALIAGNQDAPSLQAVNSAFREAFMSALHVINPRTYRLGSGREEPDGAVSFLVHFLGREQGITGELYVRPRENRQVKAVPSSEGDGEAGDSAGAAETAPLSEGVPSTEGGGEPAEAALAGPVVWEFEDLILEDAQERGVEADSRFDFPPYERFF
jgi:hypothetical protein